MRILLLTQWFDPEPTFKGIAFARALTEVGHEVEVLTGIPNYPGGKIYPGYKLKAYARESVNGISVMRVALYPSHDSSGLRRALGYLSFGASACLFGSLFVRRPDVIYAYHPPLTTGLAAAVLSRVKRAPFVYDVQDLWPDSLLATGMVRSQRILRSVGAVCDWVYRRASYLTVLSPGFKQELTNRGVSSAKVEVIYNWCDERQLDLEPRQERSQHLGSGENFDVVFAGNMGRAQGLDAVLEAARLLAIGHPNIRFVFVGSGVDADGLSVSARRMGLTNVQFLPRMAMSKMGEVLAEADVLLVHLRDDPLFEITIPSKTQAYMAAGRPIVMAARGDAADLVSAARCGVICEPGNAQSLADAIVGLEELPEEELRQMGLRGREYYSSTLSLHEGTARFVDVFRKAIAEGNRHP